MDKRIDKMKHFVMGFVFNCDLNRVLLIKKLRPEWMAGRWNGIGGKIDPGETPLKAMIREANEETGQFFLWTQKITFICPGGTVFVYAATYPVYKIDFEQIEDEKLAVWYVKHLPDEVMNNLRFFIPLCLADVATPVMITQNTLGTD